jgi:3-oxoacyl-[acyl-carrier-protein] synthase-3
MRVVGLYVAGTGIRLGESVAVADAISAGWYSEAEQATSGQVAVSVADGTSAPDLAIESARDAIAASGHGPDEFGMVAHGVALYSGLIRWSVAHYVQRQLGLNGGAAFEINAACNGSMLALDLGVGYLMAHPEHPAALVTAGEVWEPVVNRWTGSKGLVLGDGGSGLVLGRKGGLARLVAIVSHSDSTLEGVARGGRVPGLHTFGVVSSDGPRAKGSGLSGSEVWKRRREAARFTVAQALHDARVTLDEIDYVLVPFLGTRLIEAEFGESLGLPLSRVTSCAYGQQIGHTGASDLLIGLHRLAETGPARGERVLMVGSGSGESWTAAVLVWN